MRKDSASQRMWQETRANLKKATKLQKDMGHKTSQIREADIAIQDHLFRVKGNYEKIRGYESK